MRLLLVTALLSVCYSVSAASVSLEWDASSSTGALQYIVHYGTSPGVYTAHESAGTAMTKTISGLPDGFRYYFAVTAKSLDEESVMSNEINYREAFNNPLIQFVLQAETAILEAPMFSVTNYDAMDGKYVVSTNVNAGECKFVVTVPFVDEFIIWARTLSPNTGQDSFCVSHNNRPEDVYDTTRFWESTWQWTTVNGRGGIDKPLEMVGAIDPRIFLMAGTNEVRFRAREVYTGLDAILITNDPNLIPQAPSSPILQLTVGR